MNFMNYLVPLLFFLLPGIYQPICCQSVVDPPMLSSDEGIVQLKESALVVRLNMKKRTLDALQKQLQRKSISQNDSIDIALRIKDIENNRMAYKRNVIQSFARFYKFSDIYFIENHQFKQMLRGGTTELETVDGTTITSENLSDYFVLVNGYNDHNWIIKQKNLSDMPNGFPNEYNSGFKRVVNWIAGQSNVNVKDMSKIAIKINERLFKYYNKIKKEY